MWEILKDAGIDPAPERASSTWAAFLRSQADALSACDFFETVTLAGTRIYSAGITERQSVEGADTVGREFRGYDAGKKINRRKRRSSPSPNAGRTQIDDLDAKGTCAPRVCLDVPTLSERGRRDRP